jgi:hypothetical protein
MAIGMEKLNIRVSGSAYLKMLLNDGNAQPSSKQNQKKSFHRSPETNQ